MPRFKFTLESMIDASDVADAIVSFKQSPFAHGVSVQMVEVIEPSQVEAPAKPLTTKVIEGAAALVKDAAAQAGIAELTRFCPDHNVAMEKRPSKFGKGRFYFSCPVKLDDGSYCKAKPQ